VLPQALGEPVVAPRSTGHAVARDTSTEPLVNLNARVPKHLWRRVRLRCLEEGRLLRAFITEALREHLRSQTRRH
jgi:hypothetical protein